MTLPRPPITSTTHPLPFDKLSPRDFERLCLWLVQREGYERAEHLGAAGSEQGRDVIAWREGELWAFQCKRVRRFGPREALAEVEKVLALPEVERPVVLLFLVTCDVSANTRQQARERCEQAGLACHFWTGTELDEKVKRHSGIVREFFDVHGPVVVAGGGAQVTVTVQDENLRDKELAYILPKLPKVNFDAKYECEKLVKEIEKIFDTRTPILEDVGIETIKSKLDDYNIKYRFEYKGQLTYFLSFWVEVEYGRYKIGFHDGWTELPDTKGKSYTAMLRLESDANVVEPIINLQNLSLLNYSPGIHTIKRNELLEGMWDKTKKTFESIVPQIRNVR